MDVRIEQKEGIAVCYIKGEVNINTVSALKESFKTLLDGDSKKVVLNMSEVDYIDSLGLATLIKFYRDLEENGGGLALSNITPKIGSIFRITKVDKALNLFETEEDALNNLV